MILSLQFQRALKAAHRSLFAWSHSKTLKLQIEQTRYWRSLWEEEHWRHAATREQLGRWSDAQRNMVVLANHLEAVTKERDVALAQLDRDGAAADPDALTQSEIERDLCVMSAALLKLRNYETVLRQRNDAVRMIERLTGSPEIAADGQRFSRYVSHDPELDRSTAAMENEGGPAC